MKLTAPEMADHYIIVALVGEKHQIYFNGDILQWSRFHLYKFKDEKTAQGFLKIAKKTARIQKLEARHIAVTGIMDDDEDETED